MAIRKSADEIHFSTNEAMTVETIGVDRDRRDVIHVPAGDGPAWNLVRLTGRGDDELRIRDLDLARWLEFAEPRMIRKIIKRHARAGNINPVAVCYTVERAGGRPPTEYLLSEADALFIATQSETAKAVQVTKQMIRVFGQARRGLLPSQRADISPVLSDAIVKLTQLAANTQSGLTALTARVDALHAQLEHRTSRHGLLGLAKAREILEAIAAITDLSCRRKTAEWRSKRRAIDIAVRDAAGLGSARWEVLDAANEGRAWHKLGELRARAQADAAAQKKAEEGLRQRTLFDALPPGIKAFSS